VTVKRRRPQAPIPSALMPLQNRRFKRYVGIDLRDFLEFDFKRVPDILRTQNVLGRVQAFLQTQWVMEEIGEAEDRLLEARRNSESVS
jgi:hypothetical protein